MLIRRSLLFLLLSTVLITFSACSSLPPPSTPTAAPSPIPTDTPTIAPTSTPTPTPLSTDTPESTDVPLPTVPTETLIPPIPTLDPSAEPLPMVTVNPGGVITLTITEEQLNAELAFRFATAPITYYTISPVVNLDDGSLEMVMKIVPLKAPSGSNPLAVSLTVTLEVYGGALDIQPRLLSPLDAGVTARQVKLGQALLFQTLTEMVAQAVGQEGSAIYTGITIQPDGIVISLAKAG